MELSISENREKSRFETKLDGKTAFIDYKRKSDVMYLTHTEVPEELGGKGVGSSLVKFALEAAKKEGKKVISQCSFVSGYIERHPKFKDYLV
ncbi:GNAT family N-acetyltransferase [Rasiella sp. SM2506]|uniref:GNAT family N-acetyltransferase n=1 Tax=Rasiella sp. SM2506 TaxID=3423914 RepID=UPI003D7AA657